MMHVAECRIVLAVPRHVLGRMGYYVLLIGINNQEFGINEVLADFLKKNFKVYPSQVVGTMFLDEIHPYQKFSLLENNLRTCQSNLLE